MMETIENHTAVGEDGTEVEEKSFNSIYIMADSGARGGPAQIKQHAWLDGETLR